MTEPRRARLVLVEDNPGDILLVRTAVSENNIAAELLAFQTAAAARKYFEEAQTPPDLLLLDINLTESNGLDLLGELRAGQRYTNLPVAVLSSSLSQRDRERARDLRVLQFIEKPASLDDFLSTVGGSICELLSAR